MSQDTPSTSTEIRSADGGLDLEAMAAAAMARVQTFIDAKAAQARAQVSLECAESRQAMEARFEQAQVELRASSRSNSKL